MGKELWAQKGIHTFCKSFTITLVNKLIGKCILKSEGWWDETLGKFIITLIHKQGTVTEVDMRHNFKDKVKIPPNDDVED